MSSFNACPYCGRTIEYDGLFNGNYFPVYTCSDCGTKYCSDEGPPCPECDCSEYGQFDEVYYRE